MTGAAELGAAATSHAADVFRVLHVGTGNICRSPMAERLMRSGLENRLGGQAGLRGPLDLLAGVAAG